MRIPLQTRLPAVCHGSIGLAALAALVTLGSAVPAAAQLRDRLIAPTPPAIGEKYHIELGGTLWNPALTGIVSSDQFGIIGSDIDFVKDLGFQKTRFRDLRIVLRPATKHRFRLQYTPVEYTSDTTFTRDIVFNGIRFPLSVPVQAQFGWKVWRFGYEYDAYYASRGFVGVLFEARYTQLSTALTSKLADEYTIAKAPLPAIGLVARGYVLPEVAIDFEVSGFKIPKVAKKYEANYFDWDLHGTVNLTNNFGLQVGWRRATTFLGIDQDKGDLKFQGMWFGAAVRY
jgi:hypothetical protein